MQVSVVQIGNSKGIRLSKILLEKYQIEDKMEMVLEDDGIKLKPISAPRKNWEASFAEMRINEDDKLLIDSVFENENWE